MPKFQDSSALPDPHCKDRHIILRLCPRPVQHLLQHMLRHLLGVRDRAPLDDRLQQDILLSHREGVKYSVRHHDHKIPVAKLPLHRVDLDGIHHADGKACGTQMLHAVFLFNKCGGGSRLDDLALPAVQIEHRHIDSRIMDLLPAHHKRCIDHLDRPASPSS